MHVGTVNDGLSRIIWLSTLYALLGETISRKKAAATAAHSACVGLRVLTAARAPRPGA